METIIYKGFAHRLKGADEKRGIVELYANAFNNKDADGDVSLPGSFNRTIKNNFNRIKHLFNHDRSKFVGLPLEMKADDFGLKVTSQLNMATKLGQDVFADYLFFEKMERSPEHSIGARILDYEKNEDIAPGYIVKEWHLLEYSTVPFGANENTPMIGLKSLENAFDFEAIFKGLETMLALPYSDDRKRNIDKLLKLLSTNKDQSTNGPATPPVAPLAQNPDYSILKTIKF
jgi:HK97 family phage prohead protease